jgi:hypothetical protein
MSSNPYLENPYLNRFGQTLMRRVRDASIEHWDSVVQGRMRGPDNQRVATAVAAFTPEQRLLVEWLIVRIVDVTIHSLLSTIEEDESIKVQQCVAGGDCANIAEISDGLGGEPYGDEGWIARFSQERHYESYPAGGA